MPQQPVNRTSAPVRPRISLDGLWDFAFEGPTAKLSGEGHRIRSPGIWQTQFPRLRNAQGTGRYRRTVEVPADWAGKRVVLVMEGVFHESVVLVDEAPVRHSRRWLDDDRGRPYGRARRQGILRPRRRSAHARRSPRRPVQPVACRKAGLVRRAGRIWKPAWIEARDPINLSELSIQTSYDLAQERSSPKAGCRAKSRRRSASFCRATGRFGRMGTSNSTPPRSNLSSPLRIPTPGPQYAQPLRCRRRTHP